MSTSTGRGLTNYTRWVAGEADVLHADILCGQVDIAVDRTAGTVRLNDKQLSPDEARMVGVRLIDAAVLADGPAAIRDRRSPAA